MSLEASRLLLVAIGGAIGSGCALRARGTRATFLLIGLLGGFPTFSTYSYQTFALMQVGHGVKAFANAVGQLVLGVGLVWLGFVGSRAL